MLRRRKLVSNIKMLYLCYKNTKKSNMTNKITIVNTEVYTRHML